jgi:hypothetical protein
MSTQTNDLLAAYDALTIPEKRAFTAEFLKRVVPFDSGPLDDRVTGHAAELFAGLEAEETDTSSRQPAACVVQDVAT